MCAKSIEGDLSRRLISSTFFVETGINISLMFCLDTLMVDTYSLTGSYKQEAATHFRNLLTSNEVAEGVADRVVEFFSSTYKDSPLHLESILALLDSALSFDIAFFFTILDPEKRDAIRNKCIELVPRYRGILSEADATKLVGKMLDFAEERVFSDKRFAVLLPDDKLAELDADFKEYLRKYRDSSSEEIQEQKVRYNIAAQGGPHVAMPQEISEEHFRDWRSFCRFHYLSNRFSIFPELREHEVVSLATQESLFIPRPALINRAQENKQLRLFDGIRYFRDRLKRTMPKCMNLYGPKGRGLSVFARMLTIQMASSYSRGHSKQFPIYIDLAGRTAKDLIITSIIDGEILRDVDELTSSWQMAGTVIIFDNFDKVLFKSDQERDRFLSSFADMALLLRKGGVVIVTNEPVQSVTTGIELETITLEPFDTNNIEDWFKSWSAALKKGALDPNSLSAEMLYLFREPENLWMAMQHGWDELRKVPSQTIPEFASNIVSNMVDEAAKYLLLGERKSVDPDRIHQFVKELAWTCYVRGSAIPQADINELCDRFSLDIRAESFIRLSSIRIFDVKGNSSAMTLATHWGFLRNYLIASRFLENVDKKELLLLLGKRYSDAIFLMITGLIAKRFEQYEALLGINELKRLRDTLWNWYSYSAVVVMPQRSTKVGIVISDFDLFADFRLFCLLLVAELTRMIKDERPLTLNNPKAISYLIKSLQSNPASDRIDFKKYLANSNLRGVVFEDIDLENANFSNCRLNEARFLRCNMTGVDLQFSSIVGGNFDNCSMNSVNVSNADLTGCRIRYCDLSGSLLRETKIDASSFVYVSLNRAVLVGINMTKSNCNMTNFEGANLIGGKFDRSGFERVDFSGAKLVAANFSNCELVLCTFKQTNLMLAVFSGSKLHNVTLVSCDAAGILANTTEFVELISQATTFEECDITRSNLTEARLRKSDFTSADLTGSKFDNADLRESVFNDASIAMTNMIGVAFHDSKGLDLIRAAEGADVTNATGIDLKGRMALKKLGAKDLTRPTAYG